MLTLGGSHLHIAVGSTQLLLKGLESSRIPGKERKEKLLGYQLLNHVSCLDDFGNVFFMEEVYVSCFLLTK